MVIWSNELNEDNSLEEGLEGGHQVKGCVEEHAAEDAFGYVVRSRFQNNSSEEIANKEVKNAKENSLNSLKIDGSACEDKDTIDEGVIANFNALFNGQHGVDMKDTGEPFKPDYGKLFFFTF